MAAVDGAGGNVLPAPGQVEPPPPPIIAGQGTFELGADTEALRSAATAMRDLGGRAESARDTVHAAADWVESDDAWRGDTADNYQSHRRRLNTDIVALHDATAGAADTLDRIASLLDWYQVWLDGEQASIAAIPTENTTIQPRGSDPIAAVSYRPATQPEADLVLAAVERAVQLEAELDDQLVVEELALRRAINGSAAPTSILNSAPGLAALAETWERQSIRHVNYNIGSGNDRGGGDIPGADVDEIDQLAADINRQGADVITLQEVFQEDLDDIEEGLDGDWEIYYAHADGKYRDPTLLGMDESFGNAVLVRQGDGLESRAVEDGNRVKLDETGYRVDLDESPSVPAEDVPESGRRYRDGEARVAAVAEITIDR